MGLEIDYNLTGAGWNLYDTECDTRHALIQDAAGKTIYELKNVEAPKSWSDLAVNVVASKYFRKDDRPESSVLDMVRRVAQTITDEGEKEEYFADDASAGVFQNELEYILVNQMASFNSPVWFNVGRVDNPQCSACFILSVEDHMESILDWYKKEGMIFKGGSGAGVNLSRIRGSMEQVDAGGKASGPVSFMRGADSSAGAIKSGGTTRRSAKMVILDADHPDIEEFIWCKAKEEDKVRVLGEAGYDVSFNSDIWYSVQFQNANNSVRVTDAFMEAATSGEDWYLNQRAGDGETVRKLKASELLDQIAEAAWKCGDPGMQFDTIINKYNTIKSRRINASNPCSEYMHMDDSACNLASLNLLKFLRDDNKLDVEKFCHVVHIMTIAMDIIVGMSSYPTPEIEANAKKYRQLGIGYANLGALLMSLGIPYDSDKGRVIAAYITSLLSARAYKTSAILADALGCEWSEDEDDLGSTIKVLMQHQGDHHSLYDLKPYRHIWNKASELWDVLVGSGYASVRNAQISVLAPTGTIGFMMDCDTTGVEPDIALVKYKTLAGGGTLKYTNQSVERALKSLGYDRGTASFILEYLRENDTIEGTTYLQEKHLPVFDCAFKPTNGKRSISWKGHVDMMAAVQPFLSGAISKTVNLPADATVEDVKEAFIYAWKQGIKAIAIYRDGSKNVQPLTTKAVRTPDLANTPVTTVLRPWGNPPRRKLEKTRDALTHHFDIGGQLDGYITVGMYENGDPGEIFIKVTKQGSTISGLVDALSIMMSIALQHGIPLSTITRKLEHMRFEPSGITGTREVAIAKSVVDYVARWLSFHFDPERDEDPLQLVRPPDKEKPSDSLMSFINDGEICTDCGSMMVRNGSCYKCLNCGGTSGCS